jgi:hypothetical protein
MKDLTVKQPRRSPATVRTLHHYDETACSSPPTLAERLPLRARATPAPAADPVSTANSAPLEEIAELLELRTTTGVAVLLRHRERLEVEARRYAELIRTIDLTVAGMDRAR